MAGAALLIDTDVLIDYLRGKLQALGYSEVVVGVT